MPVPPRRAGERARLAAGGGDNPEAGRTLVAGQVHVGEDVDDLLAVRTDLRMADALDSEQVFDGDGAFLGLGRGRKYDGQCEHEGNGKAVHGFLQDGTNGVSV